MRHPHLRGCTCRLPSCIMSYSASAHPVLLKATATQSLFHAATEDGYTVKILAELLQNTIKMACLHVHADGIGLRMMDSHRHVLIDIHLPASHWKEYSLEPEELYLGINLCHLYRMLKSVKKKDTLILSIDTDTPTQLQIRIAPKEQNRMTTSCIHIRTLQSLEIPLPQGYGHPIAIPSGEYQRSLKDLQSVNSKILVALRDRSILLQATADQIFSKQVLFGVVEDDSPVRYQEWFDTDNFARILKVAGLSNQLFVYAEPSLPILFESKVGQLGWIRVYIKSRDMCAEPDVPPPLTPALSRQLL